MVATLFDSHAHLDEPQFEDCRDEVVIAAKEAGIKSMITIGTTYASSLTSVELAQKYDAVYAAVGIQPNYTHEASAGDWEQLTKLTELPEVVAVGETGLDRYWDYAPFALQQDYFDRHLRLSQSSGLPFIVHLREGENQTLSSCEDEILKMLREARKRGTLSGVMHSYTGSLAGAKECLELGLYISFAGMVTFKKSDQLRALAKEIPADRILIETDAPYLSPHPVRGVRPNQPAHLVHTASCLAEVRGASLEQFAAETTANAQRLFQLENV